MASANPGSVDGTANEPKLLLPFLAPLYALLVPLAWPIVRLGTGLIFAVHGWRKIVVGPGPFVDNFAKMGFASPSFLFYFLIFVEFVGGVCVALGFFTRFFAAAATIELAYITVFIYMPKAFAWNAPGGGYEYTLFWGLMFLAIWLRGGGPYSVDRLLKRQL